MLVLLHNYWSLSYVTALDDIGDDYFSIGFQGGLNQNSIDLSKTTWDTQWNGDTYDPHCHHLSRFSYSNSPTSTSMLVWCILCSDGNNSLALGASMSHVVVEWSFVIRQGCATQKNSIFTEAVIYLWTKKISTGFNPDSLSTAGFTKEIVAGGFLKTKYSLNHAIRITERSVFSFWRIFTGTKTQQFLRHALNTTRSAGISYDLNTSNLSNLAGSASCFWDQLSYVMYVKRGGDAKNFNKMPRFLQEFIPDNKFVLLSETPAKIS